MAHAGCHRIFGRDAGSAAFHSKSLITFKETRIKNHRYFLTHNSCTKQTLCRLHENSSDWCIASPCLKEEYILLPSSLISEVNMPCSFNMLVFFFTDSKTWGKLYLYLHPSQSEYQILNLEFFVVIVLVRGVVWFSFINYLFSRPQSDLYFPTSISELFCGIIKYWSQLKSAILWYICIISKNLEFISLSEINLNWPALGLTSANVLKKPICFNDQHPGFKTRSFSFKFAKFFVVVVVVICLGILGLFCLFCFVFLYGQK